MGVFLQSAEANPCGHHLKWKITPINPPADTMFMDAMSMVLPWKIVEDFQSSVKNTKLLPSLIKSVSCNKMGLKSSHCSCLKACLKGYTHCVSQHFWSDHQLEHSKTMNERKKKCSNDLVRSKFCQQVQSFVWVPPWRRVTFKFCQIPKNASEVTLVPKIFFS
jgi:hypothetical protein